MSSNAWLDPKKDFVSRVGSLYAPGGLMSQKIPGFRPREGQQAFAEEVARAIEARSTLIAEAGTGTGKTFAYLIPAIVAGVRTIVSTAGKSLQDQLYHKDIPQIRKTLGLPVTVSLLKGRANYICPYRLELAQSEDMLPERDSYQKLRLIAAFAAHTETGDKAELPDVPEDDRLWPMVTSTRENCLGREKCPHWDGCFVRKAREKALNSDVVIVNHHLFLSSLALRKQTNQNADGLLPDAGLTVIDEAHQLPQIASDFFGDGFSTRQLEEAVYTAHGLSARDTLTGVANWADLRARVDRACKELRLAVSELGVQEGDRVALDKLERYDNLYERFVRLEVVCEEFLNTLVANEGRDPELDTLLAWTRELVIQVSRWCALLAERCPELAAQLASESAKVSEPSLTQNSLLEKESESADAQMNTSQADPEDPENPLAQEKARQRSRNYVVWLEYTKYAVRFNSTPLSFAKDFQTLRNDMGGAWVFTSATLSTGSKQQSDQQFNHFKAELGIQDSAEFSWESPFNYWEQGCLYIPMMPDPANNTVEHTRRVVQKTWPIICAAQGRTFFLCTSLLAVREAADQLARLIDANALPYKLLVQGEAPKTTLVNEFRQHGNAILVGSMSFWEGVDVRGDALSVVIIDKIPFSPPNDPVSEARCNQIRARGGDPFALYTVPEAIIALKQGVGRLIRSESDRGVVVLCDARLVSKPSYGPRITGNLPDFFRTRKEQKALEFFLNPQRYHEGLYQ